MSYILCVIDKKNHVIIICSTGRRIKKKKKNQAAFVLKSKYGKYFISSVKSGQTVHSCNSTYDDEITILSGEEEQRHFIITVRYNINRKTLGRRVSKQGVNAKYFRGMRVVVCR